MTKPRICTALSAALLVGAVIGHALPAHAVDLDRKPVLRSNVNVRSDTVTVGDFFEGAGTAGATAIFRSPDLGKTGSVAATKVVAAAKAAGLYDAEAGTLVNVIVTHEARVITRDDMQRLIADAAVKQAEMPAGTELQISFDQPIEARNTDPKSGDPMHLAGLTYSPITGRFEAIVIFDEGTGISRERVRGSAIEMVASMTLTRTINKGEIIAQDDLLLVKQPRRAVGNGNGKAIDSRDVVGMAAKHALRPDQVLTAADFGPPTLVARGDTVTLVFELPGLMVSARGTAMDNGIKGEVISVLNPTSKRIVHGTVTGQGKVQVVGGILTANADDVAKATNGRLPQ